MPTATHITTDQITTRLSSGLRFVIIRMHGKNGFPERGLGGHVFLHREDRELPQRYTGIPSRRKNDWVVRPDRRSGKWRIDRWDIGPLFDCPSELSAMFDSPREAAQALDTYLGSITEASL